MCTRTYHILVHRGGGVAPSILNRLGEGVPFFGPFRSERFRCDLRPLPFKTASPLSRMCDKASELFTKTSIFWRLEQEIITTPRGTQATLFLPLGHTMAAARLARTPSKRWVQDEEVSGCPLCPNRFDGNSFLDLTKSGRTHCRYCGGVFCTDCCCKELYMPEDEVS